MTATSSRLTVAMAAGALVALLTMMPAGGEPELRFARGEYPVVDGSTSTQPLGMLIAGRVTSTSVEWRRKSFFDPTRLLVPTTAPYDASRKLSVDRRRRPPTGRGRRR